MIAENQKHDCKQKYTCTSKKQSEGIHTIRKRYRICGFILRGSWLQNQARLSISRKQDFNDIIIYLVVSLAEDSDYMAWIN